ncbi:MAG: hypothetical protein CO108_07315 [Deltaproteobacteria bacterium CG_4_9_14_3_um_filter_63_12]|nr:MAG: hypothetical protein CO108_07315 [Deltaproteobacteria bacterium CG_4_9_14_3_um_filter_63_12]
MPRQGLSLLLLVLAVLVCGASGCTSPAEQVRSALDANRLDEARAIATVALAETPNDGELHTLMARVALAEGQLEEAIGQAERGVVLNPEDLEAHRVAARVYREADRPGSLCAELWSLYQLSPESVKAFDPQFETLLSSSAMLANDRGASKQGLSCFWTLEGLTGSSFDTTYAKDYLRVAEGYAALLVGSGRYFDAIALLDELDSRFPEQNKLHQLGRGQLLLELEEVDAALEALSAYVAADPDGRGARAAEVGKILARSGRDSEALEAYAAAIEADPQDTDRRFEAARILLRNGNGPEAGEQLDAYLSPQRVPPPTALDFLKVGQMTTDLGWADIGLARLQLGMKTFPANEEIAFMVAGLQNRLNEPAQVEATFAQVVDASSPKGAVALAVADWCYAHGYDELSVHYYQLAAAEPDAPQDMYFKLAQAYRVAMDFGAMERALLEHVNRMEGSRKARAEAANVALEAGSFQRASELLIPAFQAHPEDQEIAQLLAEAYENLGLTREKQATLTQWAEVQTPPEEGYIVLGEVYAEEGYDELAEEYYRKAFAHPELGIEARYLLAILFHRRGEVAKSDVLFAEFVDASSDRKAAQKKVFEYYRDYIGDTERAIELAEQMVAEDPAAIELLYQIGSLRMLRKEDPEAVDAFVRYAERSADIVDGAYAAVLEIQRKMRFDVAIDTCKSLIEKHPELPALQSVLGDAYWSYSMEVLHTEPALAEVLEGQAQEAYWRYIEGGDSPERMTTFAGRMRGSQLFPLAAAAYDAAGALPLRGRQGLEKGSVMLILKRVDDAIAAFGPYIDSTEPRARALVEVARALIDANHEERALPYLKEAMKLDRAEIGLQAYGTAGELLIVSGRAADLAALHEQALKNGGSRYDTLDMSARLFTQAGLYDRALDTFDAMLSLRPNAVDVALKVAQVGLLVGDSARAEKVLTRFIEASPTPAMVWTSVGDLYFDRGEAERAVAAYENAAAATQLADDRIFMRLGTLKAQLGDFDGAQAAFAAALQNGVQTEAKYETILEAFARASKLQLADKAAADAIDKVGPKEPFVLFKLRLALSVGRRAAALQWTEDYAKANRRINTLVDVMLGAGSFEHARNLLLTEFEHNEFDAANAHLFDIAPRALLYQGLSRFIAFSATITAGPVDPAPVSRMLAELQADADRVDDALVTLGELRPVGNVVVPRDVFDHAELLLRSDHLDQAREELVAFLLHSPLSNPAPLIVEAAQLLVDADQVDAALELYALGVAWGYDSLLTPWLDLLVEQGQTLAALDLLEGGPLSAVFTTPSDAEEIAAVADGIERLLQRGFAAEALTLVRSLEAAQGPAALTARIAIQALANTSDPALAQAIKDYRSAFATPEASIALARLLATLEGTEPQTQLVELARELMVSNDDALALEALELAAMSLGQDPLKTEGLIEVYVSARFNRYRAFMNVAAVLEDIGRFENAANALQNAKVLLPNEPAVYVALARNAYLAGDFEVAIDATLDAAKRSEDRVGTLLKSAIHYAKGPDSGIASAALEAARTTLPFDARVHLELARQAYLSGRVEEGERWVAAYLDMADSRTTAAASVLVLLLEANQVQRALTLAEEILAAENTSDSALWQAGLAFLRADDEARAIQAFDRATTLTLGALELKVAIAETFRRRGRLDQAERFLEKALEDQPDSSAPHLYRGLFRLQRGDAEGAMMDFDLAIQGGYRPVETLRVAAEALLKAGEDARAASLIAKLPVLSSVEEEERGIAVLEVYGDQDRAADGIAALKERAPGLLRNVERRPALALALTVALLRANALSDAESVATQTRDLNPERFESWDGVARVLIAKGEASAAVAPAKRAVQLATTDLDRARALATLGRANYHAAARDEAERSWLAAIRLAAGERPEWNATVLRALAKLAEEAKRPDDVVHYQTLAARFLAGTLEPDGL